MATLINGNLNDPVYAAQDADLIAAICGNQTCITPVGGKFEATLEDANTIMVEDGVIITQEGRRIQLDVGDIDEFIIPTGSQGITQYYIVGYRLYTDSESAELCENFVEPVDSASETINEGTFRGGETEVYVSLLRVKQEGVNITDIEVLLPYSTDITQINNDLANKTPFHLIPSNAADSPANLVKYIVNNYPDSKTYNGMTFTALLNSSDWYSGEIHGESGNCWGYIYDRNNSKLWTFTWFFTLATTPELKEVSDQRVMNGITFSFIGCHELVNGTYFDGFKINLMSNDANAWQTEYAVFWNLPGVYSRKYMYNAWTDWAKSGFNNVSTSVRYNGTGSYTVPQTGTYLFTNEANVNNIGGCIPYINGVAKGYTVGVDGCLNAIYGGPVTAVTYALDLNAGDVVSSGYTFQIALLI